MTHPWTNQSKWGATFTLQAGFVRLSKARIPHSKMVSESVMCYKSALLLRTSRTRWLNCWDEFDIIYKQGQQIERQKTLLRRDKDNQLQNIYKSFLARCALYQWRKVCKPNIVQNKTKFDKNPISHYSFRSGTFSSTGRDKHLRKQHGRV